MGNSAVQIQRVSKARDMLIDGFQDAPNEAVRNYIKQLEGSLKFNLKRLKPLKKKGGKEVTEIGLEFKGDNRKVTDVPLEKGIQDYRNVNHKDTLLKTALSLGIYLGKPE